MAKKDENYVKVLFTYHSPILDALVREGMWATTVDEEKGIYKLDNISFLGAMIATDDEFFAEFDEEEQALTYRKTVTFSGNSIVLVFITKKGFDKQIIRKEFKKLNCTSEGANDKSFSMEILKNTNYSEIKWKLDDYEKQGIIAYEEPYLSKKHLKDLKLKKSGN